MLKRYFTPILILVTYCMATSAFVGLVWSVPQPPAISAKELIPLASWQKQFKITEGKDRGRTVPLISQPAQAMATHIWGLCQHSWSKLLPVP